MSEDNETNGDSAPEFPRQVYSIDIDGVLADFILEFTAVANQKFKTPVISQHSQEAWDLVGLLTPEQLAETWAEVERLPGFWYDMKPLATGIEFDLLHSLAHDENSQVLFLTARMIGPEIKRQTEAWLMDAGVCAPNVVVTEPHESKVREALRLGVNVLLDDHAPTCQYASERGVPHVYLLQRLYNRGYEFPPETSAKVKRVGSLVEFFWHEHHRREPEWSLRIDRDLGGIHG